MARKHIPIQTGQPDYDARPSYQNQKKPQNTQNNPRSYPNKSPQYAVAPAAKNKQSKIKKYLWIPVVVLALVGVAFLAKGYLDTRNELAKLSGSNSAAQADGEQLVDEIGKFFVLPEETPTVATVNDVSKLQDQEFFKNAQTGDKVLIFPEAGRALLYRPSTGKVIEYSKVNLNTSEVDDAASTQGQ